MNIGRIAYIWHDNWNIKGVDTVADVMRGFENVEMDSDGRDFVWELCFYG